MKTTHTFSSDTFFREARKRAILHAALRPESAIIVAVAMFMIGLCALQLFWFPWTWWIWALFGIAGVAVTVYLSLKDDKFLQQIKTELFYERFDQSKLRLPELQEHVSEALEYHRLLFQEIARRPYAPLGEVASDMDRLVAGVYHLAYSLDSFVSNDEIKKYLLGLLQVSQTQPEPVTSADEFTRALIVRAKNRRGTAAAYAAYEEAGLLDNVCTAVAGAAGEIQDTIKNISAVHRRIAVTPPRHSDNSQDWSFVEVIRDSFDDHANSLSQHADEMISVYHSCESAARHDKPNFETKQKTQTQTHTETETETQTETQTQAQAWTPAQERAETAQTDMNANQTGAEVNAEVEADFDQAS